MSKWTSPRCESEYWGVLSGVGVCIWVFYSVFLTFFPPTSISHPKVYEFKELPHSRGQQRRQQRKQAAEEKRRRTEEEQQEARQNAWDDDEDDDVDGEVGADDDGAAQDGDGEPGMAPSAASSATKPEDQFNPCYCTECNTLVRTCLGCLGVYAVVFADISLAPLTLRWRCTISTRSTTSLTSLTAMHSDESTYTPS